VRIKGCRNECREEGKCFSEREAEVGGKTQEEKERMDRFGEEKRKE
jgi:hypothetical protein